jgi:hypothetical protein
MTTVKTPLVIRVPAYLAGLILAGIGSPVVAFLLGKHVIDELDAAFIVALIGVTSSLAHLLALAHLSLPDDDTTPEPVTGTPLIASRALGDSKAGPAPKRTRKGAA